MGSLAGLETRLAAGLVGVLELLALKVATPGLYVWFLSIVVFLRLHLLSLESYPRMIQHLVKADFDEVR